MIYLRSCAFHIAFILWTGVIGIPTLPLLFFSPRITIKVARWWAAGSLWLLAVLAGTRARLDGLEHLSGAPSLVAAKHQSTWDTLILSVLLPFPAIIHKRELNRIPIFGWYLWGASMVPIDRAGGAKALRAMVTIAKARLADGRDLVIYPEGTRVRPGEMHPYHVGVAALYKALSVQVVPVALNSGLFWPKGAFLIQPGTIRLTVMEPIAPGLDRETFLKTLEERIETQSHRLLEDQRLLEKETP